ncbi:hypothetical protein [Bdellovibrio sp. HCB337]|uniref:hypothetical protein n=1 Tax=Bdellovibrio sp. HCB337 TaxID=3394358 RepID=UPI0039A44E47
MKLRIKNYIAIPSWFYILIPALVLLKPYLHSNHLEFAILLIFVASVRKEFDANWKEIPIIFKTDFSRRFYKVSIAIHWLVIFISVFHGLIGKLIQQ